MAEDCQRKIKTSSVIILVLVGVALLALAFGLFSFVRIYRDLHRHGLLYRQGRLPFERPVPDYALRRQQQSGNIRDWMTFSYINRVFGLPNEYLQSKLIITDKKYPNVSISSWAKQSHQEAQELTSQLINLIRNYQSASSTPVKTPSPTPGSSI